MQQTHVVHLSCDRSMPAAPVQHTHIVQLSCKALVWFSSRAFFFCDEDHAQRVFGCFYCAFHVVQLSCSVFMWLCSSHAIHSCTWCSCRARHYVHVAVRLASPPHTCSVSCTDCTKYIGVSAHTCRHCAIVAKILPNYLCIVVRPCAARNS
jgi:hypothetical protein